MKYFRHVAAGAFIVVITSCSRFSPGMSSRAPGNAGDVVNAIRPVTFDTSRSLDVLKPLGDAIGNKRIVLIGENGHGVAQFSMARAQIVRYLHERMGFDVVAFESGFHECREAEAR